MGKIKPTRVVTPRIIQPGEGGVRPWLWVVFLVALAAWSWQVFQFAQQRAGFDVDHHGQLTSKLRERIVELEEEREALRAEAARLQRTGQIDRAATEGVKSEIKALQDERAELKREVAFLKTLVSGGDNRLFLDDYRLSDAGEDTYRFEITVSKPAEDQSTVNGQVIIKVLGQLEGEQKVLDMETLTDGKRTNIGIRFKSFQKLKTEIRLPEGFEPASIEVAVRPEGKEFRSFEQAYDWKLSDA